MIYLQIGLQGIWKPGRCSGSVLLHFLVVFSTAPPFKQIVLDRCLLKEIFLSTVQIAARALSILLPDVDPVLAVVDPVYH
jgi:hypothetical protein